MANGLFKGNATYFGRKSGTLEDIVAKINEAPSKPEVFDMKSESEAYKKVFNAAMKNLVLTHQQILNQTKKRKSSSTTLTRTTRVRTKQWMIKFIDMNKKLKSKDGEESPVKKSVRETVRDMLMKAWKNAD